MFAFYFSGNKLYVYTFSSNKYLKIKYPLIYHHLFLSRRRFNSSRDLENLHGFSEKKEEINKMKGWNKWRGKKVFIVLKKSRRQYTGRVEEIILTQEIVWITITDKFGSLITFSADEIEFMEEEK